eukprot:CFRG2569T1
MGSKDLPPSKMNSANEGSFKLVSALSLSRCLWFCFANAAVTSHHASSFCLWASVVTAGLSCIYQNPFAKGRLNAKLIAKVMVHGFLSTISLGCLVVAIPLLSVSRAIFLFESVVVVMVTVLGMALARTARLIPMEAKRGMIMVFFGLICVWLFDSSSGSVGVSEGFGEDGKRIVVENPSTDDFATGFFLVLVAAGMEVIVQRMSRRMNSDLDSATRLAPLSQLIIVALCSLWFLFSQASTVTDDASAGNDQLLRSSVAAGVLAFVAIYSTSQLTISSSCTQWPPMVYLAEVCLSLLVLFVSGTSYSIGVISLVGYMLIFAGTYTVGLADRSITSGDGKKIAPQASNLPLVDLKYGAPAIDSLGLGGYITQAMSVSAKYLRLILSARESRMLFYFLCLNFAFMFIEFAYGVWTNSLGLMSDAFHMLFDNLALAIGLIASVIGRWSSDSAYTFGYGRVEVLSGFINGLFLIFIAVSITKEAVARLFEPPHVNTDQLLGVSFAGLVVNLIGMFALGHGHSHGGGDHGHSHGGGGETKKVDDHQHCDGQSEHSHVSVSTSSHGHVHGHDNSECSSHNNYLYAASAGAREGVTNGQSHGLPQKQPAHGHAHSHGDEEFVEEDHSDHDANMRGVFLHVLADTLGSVGVIIATLLIDNFGWWIADPICSICIALLIVLSAMPLVRQLTRQLMQRTPKSAENKLKRSLKKIRSIEGVLDISNFHCWQYTGSKTIGIMHIHVDQAASEQQILNEASSICAASGIQDMTIQIVKQSLPQLQARARQQNGFSYSPATPAYG